MKLRWISLLFSTTFLIIVNVEHEVLGQNFQWSNPRGGEVRPWPWTGDQPNQAPVPQQNSALPSSGSGTAGNVGQNGFGSGGSPNQQQPQQFGPNSGASGGGAQSLPSSPNQQQQQQLQGGQIPPQQQQQPPQQNQQQIYRPGGGPQSWQQSAVPSGGNQQQQQQLQPGQMGPVQQGQPAGQFQWYGDPNRPPDAQILPGQPVGPSMHTSADKTIMTGSSQWNNGQPAGGWSVWQQHGQPPPASGVDFNQPAFVGQANTWSFAGRQQQQQPPPQNWQQGWQQQPQKNWQQPVQGQQQIVPSQQRLQQSPLWAPGQQGWITNTEAPVSTASYVQSSPTTTPSPNDNTQFILNDLLAFHVGGSFPRDEIRQYNAKVPMPRYRRDYWLGEIYYNLDPASQLEGKLKCIYPLPRALERLHYDDGTPIGVIVFQCVQYQQRCCNVDCCNLYPPTPSPREQQRQDRQQLQSSWYGRGGAVGGPQAGISAMTRILPIILVLSWMIL